MRKADVSPAFRAATQSEFAARLAGHRRFTMSMSHRSLQAAIIEVNDTTILIIAITGGIFGVACLGISVWAYCRCKKAMKARSRSPGVSTATAKGKRGTVAAGKIHRPIVDRAYKPSSSELDPAWIKPRDSVDEEASRSAKRDAAVVMVQKHARAQQAKKHIKEQKAMPEMPGVEYVFEAYEEVVWVEDKVETTTSPTETSASCKSQPNTSETTYWFYVDQGTSKVTGPLRPRQMEALYLSGRVSESTLVRMLPFCTTPPPIEAQSSDLCSPLAELCDRQGPPFLSGEGSRSSIEEECSHVRIGKDGRRMVRQVVKKVRKVPKAQAQASAADARAAKAARAYKKSSSVASEPSRPMELLEDANGLLPGETEDEAMARREREFEEWEARQNDKAGGKTGAVAARRSSELETAEQANSSSAADEEDTYWFYVEDRTVRVRGPFKSGEMKALYLAGHISDTTHVRMIPFCTVPPPLVNQSTAVCSPLAELNDFNGPPFMSAVAVKPAADCPATAAAKATTLNPKATSVKAAASSEQGRWNAISTLGWLIGSRHVKKVSVTGNQKPALKPSDSAEDVAESDMV